MTVHHSRLLGQVLKIYLHHLLEWIRYTMDRLSVMKHVSEDVAGVLVDGSTLTTYVSNTLAIREDILCSVRGITALVAIDRAEQALNCGLENVPHLRYRSASTARNAAKLFRTSANLAVNMLRADLYGEEQLAELWNIARGLLDALLSKGSVTGTSLERADSLMLPPKPLRAYADLVACSATILPKSASTSCTERKLWACEIILTIAGHFKEHFLVNAEDVKRAFEARKGQHSADAIQYQLEATYRKEADEDAGADEVVASIFRNIAVQVTSPAVRTDLLSQLATLPPAQHYSTLMSNTVTQCASPFEYLRARASVGDALKVAGAAVRDFCEQHRTAHQGTRVERFAAKLQEQYAAAVSLVQSSPLFTQPSRDMLDEYRRLKRGIRLISLTAKEDWAFRQQCASEATAAEAQRKGGAAQAVLADSLAQAVVAMDEHMNGDVVTQWELASIAAIVYKRSEWRRLAHTFVQVADGLAVEVIRLKTAALNSEAVGRWEAGQLWRDAADMRVKIAHRMLTLSRDALSKLSAGTTAQQAADDTTLSHMTKFVRKFIQLAQLLDSEGATSVFTLQPGTEPLVTTTELLMCSVAHCKARCASLLNEGTTHLQACARYHADLEDLYDTYLSSVTRASKRLPAALEAQLLGLPEVGGTPQAQDSKTAPPWVATTLCGSSTLLLTVTDRSDLSPSVRGQVLCCVDQFALKLRPTIANIAAGTLLSPAGLAADLARPLTTAYIQAGWAALEGDLQLYTLFTTAIRYFDMAMNIYGEPGGKGWRTEFALPVADRVLNHALTARQLDSVPPSAGTQLTGQHSCAAEIEQTVWLLIQQAELGALCAAADRRNNSACCTKLRGLCDKARSMYQAAVSDEYEIATQQLTSRRDDGSDRQNLRRLEWHGARARECAKCYHEAAQALANSQTPPTLFRCLHSVARFTDDSYNVVPASLHSRIEPGRLARWFSNAVTALKQDPTDAAGNAWLRAAEKGQEVYDAEDRRVDGTLLDAGAAIALSLQDIAVAVEGQQTEQVAVLRAVVEQLEIVEVCILSANTADSQDEVNVLIATADVARSRVEELMKSSAEVQGADA
jgi:hypothetical protein